MQQILIGFFTFPVVAIAVRLIAIWIVKNWKNFPRWYYGIPPVRWGYMLMAIVGTRGLRGRDVQWMQYDGRWWISPGTRGFELGANDRVFEDINAGRVRP